jgi:hypothetical protein
MTSKLHLSLHNAKRMEKEMQAMETKIDSLIGEQLQSRGTHDAKPNKTEEDEEVCKPTNFDL